jgi:glucosamine-6-phosphate deaminase
MNRNDEIRHLNKLTEEEVIRRAGYHLVVKKSVDDMHIFFARDMAERIKRNNEAGKPTAGIFPYGPVGQYPCFIEMVNKEKISLENTWFFFMDEYADINGIEIPHDHCLSFRGRLLEMFKGIDKSLLPDYSKIIFPRSGNIYTLKQIISEKVLEITYGGVGIHGHMAFNEPEPGVRNTDPRVVQLNDFTVTINAIREGIGGNLENFPRKALTLGMNQLFSAEKMIFFCRNGLQSLDWANIVLRLALLGEPGDDYPVTYLKEHKDWLVVTDEDTLKTPRSI